MDSRPDLDVMTQDHFRPTGHTRRRALRSTMLTLLATIAMAWTRPAGAQLQPGLATGNVGDAVVAWPNGTGGRAEGCNITALTLSQGGYMVRCPSGDYWLPYAQVGKMTPEAAAALGQTAAARPTGAGGAAAGAQPAPATGDFKVGDRVESDSLGINVWEAGVVIDSSAAGWVVRNDKTGTEVNIPRSWYPSRIRPSAAALTADQQPDRSKPTGILDCPWRSGVTRRSFDTAVVKNLIRCNFDWKNGDDDQTRFDINKFTKGAARLWTWTDIGPGSPTTRVYPIRVDYTMRHWSRSYVETRTGAMVFNCFYGTIGTWQCGVAQRISESKPITRPRG